MAKFIDSEFVLLVKQLFANLHLQEQHPFTVVIQQKNYIFEAI